MSIRAMALEDKRTAICRRCGKRWNISSGTKFPGRYVCPDCNPRFKALNYILRCAPENIGGWVQWR